MARARTTPTRAERRDQTVADLVASAERLFISGGFHATSVDQVAADAGYTKGAVYANFSGKEDLFFAVWERRVDGHVAQVGKLVDELGPEEALHRMARETTTRRGRQDGWLAVSFEFWAHVLRHPHLRERFAATRRRSREPLEATLERFAAERGGSLPVDVTEAVVAMNSAQLGIALERLADPGLVAPDLGERLSRAGLEHLGEKLLPDGKGEA